MPPATKRATGKFRWVRPGLYPKQEAAIFAKERFAVVEASTKSGKTAGCIVWLVEEALKGQSGWQYWWVAPTREVAKIAYRRTKRIFPPGSVVDNRAYLTIELPNGATVSFRGADNPDALFGEDVHGAVIDEATRCKEEAWAAVRSTVTFTQGRVRIIGNVKGKKNWAYRLARRAENGEPDMAYARLTIHDAVGAGLIPQSEIEAARRDLPETVFNELYLAIASDDGGNPFGLQNITACVQNYVARTGNQNPVTGTESVDLILTPGMRALPVHGWGWDLAKSNTWTAGVGLDEQYTVTRFHRWHGRPWNVTLDDIAALVGPGAALIDQTGVGNPIVETLQRRAAAIEGFTFTEVSKQQILEQLAVTIARQQLAIPEGPLAQELRDFEYTYTRRGVRYAAPEGATDDCVMALALAIESLRRQRRSISGYAKLVTL